MLGGANGDKNDNPEGAATLVGSIRPPCSREKSASIGARKGPAAEEENHDARASGRSQGDKSKISMPSPSDVQARHDALVEAKSLMCFPNELL